LSLEPDPLTVSRIEAGERGFCPSLRRRILISVAGGLTVTGILGFVLMGRGAQFIAALHSAPIALLVLAALLQIVALLARTEAWNVCVRAAGGTVTRRVLFRAAGVGYLASVINGSVGMVARIVSLRRIAPNTTPPVPALFAAEVPIITVEVALAAIFSFTLIAPLGLPWWVPLIAVIAIGTAVAAVQRLSKRRRSGLWAGLAVLRKRGRERMIVFVLLAVCAQIARNWLMLRAIGVDVSIFDSMALLIAMFTLGQLPIGHGVALTAAAGALLAVTGTVGSLSYAAWAITDRLVAGRLIAHPEAIVVPAPSPS
jgi:uncharacterized membrane protein YbhN (UPF0104 family)